MRQNTGLRSCRGHFRVFPAVRGRRYFRSPLVPSTSSANQHYYGQSEPQKPSHFTSSQPFDHEVNNVSYACTDDRDSPGVGKCFPSGYPCLLRATKPALRCPNGNVAERKYSVGDVANRRD